MTNNPFARARQRAKAENKKDETIATEVKTEVQRSEVLAKDEVVLPQIEANDAQASEEAYLAYMHMTTPTFEEHLAMQPKFPS